MPRVALTLTSEMEAAMRRHPEISWGLIAEEAIAEVARRIDLGDRLAAQSRLRHEHIKELDRHIKAGLLRKYEKL